MQLKAVIGLVALAIFSCTTSSFAQDNASVNYDAQKDINDIIRKVFKGNAPRDTPIKPPLYTLLPAIGYNPSFGFILGANTVGGVQFGSKENTHYSTFNVLATASTKGTIILRARHNLFAPENKWNFQGDWQVSHMGIVDYGLGTGIGYYSGGGFIFNDLPIKNGDSTYPMQYEIIRLFEKVYRRIAKRWYAGLGVGFDVISDISDAKYLDGHLTPHFIYSTRNGFDLRKYSLNGLILAIQYNSRDHPSRAFRGSYIDVNLRLNQEWMGSSQNSFQFIYDVRKYFSLSKKNPEHVLAFWNWAVFTLSGKVPYLDLPGTAQDTYTRGGRGYTLGRFKGPNYLDFETEYRYPITKNKLVSGTVFMSLQTASNDAEIKIFQNWEPAGGFGLRFLFNKYSRTNLCADMAFGNYGTAGFFFGLNEVF